MKIVDNIFRKDLRMVQIEIDEIDRHLLRLLQEDASTSVSDLAERVGLSQSPCWRRINRLENEGVITRRIAVLDEEKLGFGTTVFAQVRLSSHGRRSIQEFEDAIRAFPEVIDCFAILGQADFILRIVTRDIHGYEAFVRQSLFNMPHVQEVHSMVGLKPTKDRAPLPV
jgi:Lrp/AsnC family transcriptional regulator